MIGADSTLDSLTAEQAAAARTTADRAVVSAGPGAGKTRVLAARVIHLVADGVDPRSILILTFTRSAAAEIRDRVTTALGLGFAVTATTFHAWAASLVLTGGARVANPYEEDQALRTLYNGPMRLRSRKVPGIKAMRAAIREWEAGGHDGDCAVGIKVLIQRFRQASLVPTWDLVPLVMRSGLITRYEHVLVDEAQDMTPAEIELYGLASDAGALFAVLDPRQAIMQWRGGIGLQDAPTHRLTRSFRFGANIAEQANAIAEQFGGEPVDGNGKPGNVLIQPCGESAESVGERLRNTLDQRRTLILARTNRECELIERMAPRLAHHVKRDPLDGLSRDADHFTETWARGQAVIATVHGAKGREAERVIYLRDLDAEHQNSEEQRIDYVAATRAQRTLEIITPPREWAERR